MPNTDNELFTYRERLANGARSFITIQSGDPERILNDDFDQLAEIICETWEVEKQDLIVAIHDLKHTEKSCE